MGIEKLKNTELKGAFDGMNEDQLSDYQFLSNFIYNDVGIHINVASCGVKDHENMTCWGGMRCKQYPDELAKYLA